MSTNQYHLWYQILADILIHTLPNTTGNIFFCNEICEIKEFVEIADLSEYATNYSTR